MNYLWGGMLVVGIVYGMFAGTMSEVTNAFVSAGKEAVNLCVMTAGVTALWSGFMNIAHEAGLIEKMAKGLEPMLNFLFPQLPKQHKARTYIATNMIANMLGVGGAATPAGLKAMESLAQLEDDRRRGIEQGKCRPRGTASDEMCNFLIINISSLQLIPMTIIAYRDQYGSGNPASIIGPGIVATTIGTVVAILYCLMRGGRKD